MCGNHSSSTEYLALGHVENKQFFGKLDFLVLIFNFFDTKITGCQIVQQTNNLLDSCRGDVGVNHRSLNTAVP